MSSIFVQIAAYDDDELIKTINDCINKSSGDHEIFFGVHECYIENKTVINLKNVKIKYSKAPENLGVGIARYLANQFYNNEDYYLQIDCHSRFIKNWDNILIENLERYLKVGNKCILSAYPAGFWYNENGEEEYDYKEKPSLIVLNKSKHQKEIFQNTRIRHQERKIFDETYCSESISAAFIFGPGEIYKVKQHPGIFYIGEEFLRGACFYTHGYNIMVPDILSIFHLYGDVSKRVPCWFTYPKESAEGVKISDMIVKRLLSGFGPEDPEISIWMGKERSLEMFGRYLGIDFKNGIIH